MAVHRKPRPSDKPSLVSAKGLFISLLITFLVFFVIGCSDKGNSENGAVDTSATAEEGASNSESQILFNKNCIACHGEDAKGSVGPDIRGKSIIDIKHAITKVPLMSFLTYLTIEEITLIANHLSTLTPISGKVAKFQPLWAEITIKDARGKTARTRSDPLTGEFYVEHSGLTPPLFARARGKNGEADLYGIAFSLGILNISPFTDHILGSVKGNQSPLDIFQSQNKQDRFSSATDQQQLEQAWLELKTKLDSAFKNYFPDAALDTLLNTELDLDKPGIGAVLKSLPLRGVVENCDNPGNRHGFLFDDDVDADCFSDLDT